MTVHSSVTPTLGSRTKHRVIAERTAIDCAQIEAALRERPQASDRDRLRDRMVRLVVLRTSSVVLLPRSRAAAAGPPAKTTIPSKTAAGAAGRSKPETTKAASGYPGRPSARLRHAEIRLEQGLHVRKLTIDAMRDRGATRFELTGRHRNAIPPAWERRDARRPGCGEQLGLRFPSQQVGRHDFFGRPEWAAHSSLTRALHSVKQQSLFCSNIK